jgi:uncharacterized membrane protein (UPF0182 family)
MIGLFALVALLVWAGVSIYPAWLWFLNLTFSSVFWTILLTKFGLGLVVWMLLILIISLNLYVAKRIAPGKGPGVGSNDEAGYFSQFGLSGNALNLLLIAFILIGSFIIASKGSLQWDTVLRYLHQKPFGSTDPIFAKDVGFFVFSLPFYIFVRDELLLLFFFTGLLTAILYLKDGALQITGEFVQTDEARPSLPNNIFVRDELLVLFFFTGLLTAIWYLKDGALQITGEFVQADEARPSLPNISITPTVKKHLLFLGGIIVLLLAWGFHLKTYGVLYSTQGPAFGASYTDVHVKVLAYKGLIIVSLGLAVVLFLNVFRARTKFIWISVGIWGGAVLVFLNVLPILIQKIVVKPNELAKEKRYIAYNIDYTRKAYNLNKIKEVNFDVDDQLSAKDIEEQSVTIQNIRIWDERPLLQTYRQLQSIRLYYDFNNVDVDRYVINNQYRQVMLAARELVADQLPPQANTWVNRHLKYTHGYGLALSPVSEVTREGLPRLLIKDLPPSFDADLKIRFIMEKKPMSMFW